MINHTLINMRDWDEDTDDPNAWTLVIDKGANQSPEATSFPLSSLASNLWAGASIEEIETYCLERRRADQEDDRGWSLFVVLDSAGIESKTCVLGSLPEEFLENPNDFEGRYEKVRVPWEDIYTVHSNLDIANMNWEEFVQEEQGDSQGWYTYQSIFDELPHLSKEGQERRHAEIAKARREGHV